MIDIRHGLTTLAGGAATSAAAQPAESLPPLTGGGVPVAGVTEMMLSLGLVVAAILALAWVFRRLQGTGGGRSHGLRVVASLPLGTRERLLLVEAGDQQLLIGAGGGGLRTLHVLDEPISDGDTVPATSTFAARLSQMLPDRKP